MTDPNLEEVLAQLGDLQRRLSELPVDAFSERITLREERRKLHARAAELRDANRSLEELQKELQDCQRQLDEVFDRHLSIGNIGSGGGPGGGGIDIEYVNEVNRTIDRAGDLAEIKLRIQELEAELARFQS